MDGLTRDRNGEIRHKNGNTRADTPRDTYGDTFPRLRGDMHLDTLPDRTGAKSLSDFPNRKEPSMRLFCLSFILMRELFVVIQCRRRQASGALGRCTLGVEGE